MQDAVDGFALTRIADREALTARTQQRAGVAQLTAAERVEDRAVELDAALCTAMTRAVAVLR